MSRDVAFLETAKYNEVKVTHYTLTLCDYRAMHFGAKRQDKTRQGWNRAQATGLIAPKINLTKNNFKQNLN